MDCERERECERGVHGKSDGEREHKLEGEGPVAPADGSELELGSSGGRRVQERVHVCVRRLRAPLGFCRVARGEARVGVVKALGAATTRVIVVTGRCRACAKFGGLFETLGWGWRGRWERGEGAERA